MDPRKFADRIAELDVSLFQVETHTAVGDQKSFLAIQRALRTMKAGYVYLECGSHLGGSLLPHILDPHCRLVYSVDKRPAAAFGDERGTPILYPENQTKRMITALSGHASADSMRKLVTFDLDASELTPEQISAQPDLVLIDGEHTVRAVFRDFLSLRRHCGPSTIYIFHDANLISGGLHNIETYLQYADIPFDSYVLHNSVFVLATNDAREIVAPVGRELGGNKEVYWNEVQAELIEMHHDLVETMRRASPPWQASDVAKAWI